MVPDAADELRRIREDIAQQVTDALSASAAARDVAAELAQLSGRGRSADEMVDAVVDHNGLLSAIELDDEAPSLHPDDLRASVLDAIGRARTDLQEQAARVTGHSASASPPTLPESDETLEQLDQWFQKIAAEWPGGDDL